jgi:hypothetical protein
MYLVNMQFGSPGALHSVLSLCLAGWMVLAPSPPDHSEQTE